MDKKFKNNKTIVKLICLALSFGLWMYISNVENPIRESKLDNVPVKIINEDVLKEYKLALVPNQHLTVNLNLQGPSNEIYNIKKDQFKVVVNLANYALKKGENNIPVEILNYPSNINIKNNNFLRVNIDLDNYVEKTIPIESKVKVTTSKETYIEKINFSPASATVSGPQVSVDRVKKLVVKGEMNNLTEETKMSLPIVPIDDEGKVVEDVNLSVSTTEVTFLIKKGKEVPIKIVTKGNPRNGLALKGITPEIDKVELLGSEDILNKINSIETESIDISQFGENADVTAILKIPENTVVASGKNQIKVNFIFSKTVTKEVEVPITIKGATQGVKIQLDNSSTKVKIRGLEDSIASININEIKCEADVAPLNGKDGEVKVNVINPYENIQVLSHAPENVKVMFVKDGQQ